MLLQEKGRIAFWRIVQKSFQVDHTLHAYWETGLNVFSLETPVVFHASEAGAGDSFLQETKSTRPSRNFLKLPCRALSNFREEALKRVCFYRKVRGARNGGEPD